MGKNVTVWYFYRIHENGAGDRRTECNLIFYRRSCKTFHALKAILRELVEYKRMGITCLFEDEASNLAIPFAARPYYEDITGFFRIDE